MMQNEKELFIKRIRGGIIYMKRALVLLFIVLLAVGCSSKTTEEIKPIDVEESVEIVEVEEPDEIVKDEDLDVIGEVLAKYEESFDEDISDDWLISKYVTLEPSPQGVYFENGTVRLVA